MKRENPIMKQTQRLRVSASQYGLVLSLNMHKNARRRWYRGILQKIRNNTRTKESGKPKPIPNPKRRSHERSRNRNTRPRSERQKSTSVTYATNLTSS